MMLTKRMSTHQRSAGPTAENCLGGVDAKCKEGTAGPLCAVCDEGMFSLNRECNTCPSKEAALASSIVILIVAVILIAVFTKVRGC